MTRDKLQLIRSNKITPDALYKSLDAYRFTIESAIGEEVKIGDFDIQNMRADDGQSLYSDKFVLACIEEICSAFKRINPMDYDTKRSLAARIRSRCLDWSLEELKKFADMLIAGEIPSLSYGKEEYTLKAVDESSILEKFRWYKKRRESILENKRVTEESYHGNGPSQEKKRRPLEPWQYHHKLFGEEAGPGFDPESYWYGQPPQDAVSLIQQKIQAKQAYVERHGPNDFRSLDMDRLEIIVCRIARTYLKKMGKAPDNATRVRLANEFRLIVERVYEGEQVEESEEDM